MVASLWSPSIHLLCLSDGWISAVSGEGPDRWPRELRGMQERRFGGEVKEIPEGCGCRIAAGQWCQPPFLLDRGQDRRVVGDHGRDVAGFGVGRGHQAGNPEPVAVKAAGLIRRDVDIRRDIIGGYRRGRWDMVVEPAPLVPGQNEQRPCPLRSRGESVEDRRGEGLTDLVVFELTFGREGDVRGDEADGRQSTGFAVFEELGDRGEGARGSAGCCGATATPREPRRSNWPS